MKQTPTGPKLIETQRILAKIPMAQLEFMANIASKNTFKDFENLVNWLILMEKDFIFTFPEEDPTKLAVQKSFARGKAAGFSLLAQLCKYASWEIERRIKDGA